MRIFLGILLFVVVLTSCSRIPSEDPAGRHETIVGSPVVETVHRAWSTKLRTIGQPEIAGNTAVVLVRAPGDTLAIVGLDVRTGRRLWRHPYRPSSIAGGYTTDPFVARSETGRRHVVFQRPDDDGPLLPWTDPLVAVHPRTGRIVHATEPVEVHDYLDSCLDGHDMCVTALKDGVDRRWRLDLDRRRLVEANDGVPDGARMISDGGLFSTGGTPEHLARATDGTSRWSTPMHKLFGPAHSSNFGWSVAYDEPARVYWGSVGRSFTGADIDRMWRSRKRLNVVGHGVVGFDATTGQVLWRRPGAEADCGTRSVEDLPVRCVPIGHYDEHEPGQSVSWTIRRVRFEGFELRSGRTTWSVTLRGKAARKTTSRTRRLVGALTNLRLGKGWRVASLHDGATSRAEPGEVFLCWDEIESFDYVLSWEGGHRRNGGYLYQACNVAGRAAQGLPSARALKSVATGRAPGRRWLIATAGRVTAYRITR